MTVHLVSIFLNGKVAVEMARENNASVNVLYETGKRLEHIDFTVSGLFPVKLNILIPDIFLWSLIAAPFFMYIINIMVLFIPRDGERSNPRWWEGALVEIIAFFVVLVLWIIGLIIFIVLK